MNKKRLLTLMGGSKKPPTASIGVTTTGAETLTISALTVATGKEVIVDWGDGLIDTYSGAGTRTHNYAGAGTWTVKIKTPENITKLSINDEKVTVDSVKLKDCVNMLEFTTGAVKNDSVIRSSDISAWRPNLFETGYSSNLTMLIDTSDITAWRPTTFILRLGKLGSSIVINTSDITAWRPTTFILESLITLSGTFNTAHLSAWNPTRFELLVLSNTITFNSSDLSSWNPSTIRIYGMVNLVGTFNTLDVSTWRPTSFQFISIPVGYIIIVPAGSLTGWITTTTFNMSYCNLDQTKVDQILADFWAGFATRTGTAGIINVGANNAAPSGTLQPANPPTTGKEYAYELVNDSQNVNPTKKWATVTITA